MQTTEVKLSVVVPTYRPTDIRPLLVGLRSQHDQDFEIVVVENGSDKKSLTEQLNEFNFSRPLIYVHDQSPGLNRARNVGVKASNGSHIALIDDDCVPDPDWIAAIKQAHKEYPDVGVIGGKVLLKHESALPFWLNNEMRNSLAELDYGDELFPLDRWQYLVGANLSFSRAIFNDAAEFNEELGLSGDDLIKRVNDEAEFVLKASLIGRPGAVYTGKAVVEHLISSERTGIAYLLKRWFGQGVSDVESDILLGGANKAIRSFYTVAFQSQWHLQMLKVSAAELSESKCNEFMWKGMLIRAAYLYGKRERLLSTEPVYGVLSVMGSFESRSFERGCKLIKLPVTKVGLESANNLLQCALYRSEKSISPFTCTLLILGIVNHELKLQLKECDRGTPVA